MQISKLKVVPVEEASSKQLQVEVGITQSEAKQGTSLGKMGEKGKV